MDAAVAAAGLVLGAPLLLVIGLAIWRQLGRPILFVQERPGLGGRPFRLVKFRTMRVDVHGAGRPDSERMTRLGQLLRRSSLDELPELWNVLRGEMSLVGPRPLLMEYLPLYSREQSRRHLVSPGLTGWAQIHGRNATTWEARFALDLWYLDRMSLLLDLQILWRTVTLVLSQKGVSAPGHATMERFRGNAG